MDWTDEAPFPVDRFEVQGYENTEADFNICHESCDVSECEVDDAEVCKGMHGWTSTSTTVTGTTVTTTKTQTTTTTTTTTATTQTTTSSTTTTKKVCGAGQYRDDRSNTCNACPANTFQSREQHTQTECMQPRKCTAAEVIKDAASAVSDTICATSQPCSTGEYVPAPVAVHRHPPISNATFLNCEPRSKRRLKRHHAHNPDAADSRGCLMTSFQGTSRKRPPRE